LGESLRTLLLLYLLGDVPAIFTVLHYRMYWGTLLLFLQFCIIGCAKGRSYYFYNFALLHNMWSYWVLEIYTAHKMRLIILIFICLNRLCQKKYNIVKIQLMSADNICIIYSILNINRNNPQK